jgi:hypothetical protein
MVDVDTNRLPLAGIVADFGRKEDGSCRVVFERLAAVYTVDETCPEATPLKNALARSQKTRETLSLTYALVGMKLNGFRAAAP